MYWDQRSQYIRPKSKKNSFRGNYMRKYGNLKSNFRYPILNHHNCYHSNGNYTILFRAVTVIWLCSLPLVSNLWKLFELFDHIANFWKIDWHEKLVKWHQTKLWYRWLMNSYNYFIYPYRYHTSKTNAVLLTSLKKCQQHCIGKCRCYDLYTTPICNENSTTGNAIAFNWGII